MMDHCTGWFDAWWGEACCKPHDEAYAKGGNLLDWLWSNIDLGLCVSAFGDLWSALNGPAMLVGTTILGLPFWIRARRARGRDQAEK